MVEHCLFGGPLEGVENSDVIGLALCFTQSRYWRDWRRRRVELRVDKEILVDANLDPTKKNYWISTFDTTNTEKQRVHYDQSPIISGEDVTIQGETCKVLTFQDDNKQKLVIAFPDEDQECLLLYEKLVDFTRFISISSRILRAGEMREDAGTGASRSDSYIFTQNFPTSADHGNSSTNHGPDRNCASSTCHETNTKSHGSTGNPSENWQMDEDEVKELHKMLFQSSAGRTGRPRVVGVGAPTTNSKKS